MPKYVFECQTEGCSLRFERNLKIGNPVDHPCPECAAAAPRVLEGEGFAFAFAAKAAAPIGNTGVHKDDYPTADHLVGKDSETRWESYERQKKVKDEARQMGGTHALHRHQGKDYIDYTPMSEPHRNARRNLAKAAIKAMQESKNKRS